MATPNGAFRNVLERFKHGLNQDEVEDFQFSTLEDIHKVIGDLQAEQGRKKKMMNFSRIQSFLEAMEQYGRVIEVFLNTTEFLAFVWGPVKFLLLMASTWAEAFDILLDAYKQIGENFPLLLQYQNLFKDNQYMQQVLEQIYSDILEFHRRALKFFKQRAWRQLFRASWKDFKTRFQGILENLRRHRDLLESQAGLVHYEASQAARLAAENSIRAIEEALFMQQRTSVQDWLCSANVSNDQERFTDVRSYSVNYGHWLLKRRQVSSWMDPASNAIPLFWLHGIPGAGKTILASFIIERIQRIPNIQVAYFYCKHADILKSTIIVIAKSMLVQLLRQNESLLSYLYEKSSSSGESCLETVTLAKDLLETALKSTDNVFLVIDGLDECEKKDKSAIINWFKAIINTSAESDSGRIRALFISQDDGEIRKLLPSVPKLQIKSEDNREDIRSYTDREAIRLQTKFDLSATKIDQISSKVCERAEGMFLFAKLVMKNLFQQTSRAKLDNELRPEKFPRGLEQAYARIVDNIFKDPENPDYDDAERILGWLICAKRPLKWHEIQGAISIDSRNQSVDFENRQLRVDSKDLCGSLVEVHRDETIELVHQTAKHYLIHDKYIFPDKENLKLTCLCLNYLAFDCFDIQLPKQSIQEYVRNGSYAFHEYAVAHWIHHLDSYVQGLKDTDLKSVNDLERILRDFIRLRWPNAWIQETRSSKKARNDYRMFSNSVIFENLLKVVTIARKQDAAASGTAGSQEVEIQLVTQLELVRTNFEEIMASLSLTSSLRGVFQKYYGQNWFKCAHIGCAYFYKGFPSPSNRDQHTSNHRRVFLCTVVGCHVAITGCKTAAELARHVSEFHPADQEGTNTFSSRKLINLGEAINGGRLDDVESILQAPDFDVSKYSWIVEGLRSTVRRGHDAILQRLLEVFSCNCKKYINLIRTAINHQKESTAIFLLVRQGKNPQLRQVATAFDKLLLSAASHGLEAVVEMLLKKRQNPITEKSKGPSALCLAAERGHKHVVKQLLESNQLDLRRTNPDDPTPILCAAKNGHETVVQILLQYPDCVARDSGTCWLGVAQLFNGARKGDNDLVRQLLSRKDVPPDHQSRTGQTPLILASEHGHAGVVKLLLEHKDVNPNSMTRQRVTALLYTARHGHKDIAKLLLAREDIDNSDPGKDLKHGFYRSSGSAYYGTPTDIASRYGHHSLAALLSEHASNHSQSISRRPENEGINYEADSQAESIAEMEDLDSNVPLSDSRSVSRQPEDEIGFKDIDTMDEEEEVRKLAGSWDGGQGRGGGLLEG